MEVSDTALLEACRQQDERAWELLIERYQRLIYTIPRRAGLNEELAADVFQRVFTRLFQNIDQIEQPERLRAWLTTLARRESWRVLQQEQRRAALPLDDTEQSDTLVELADDKPIPGDELIELEEQHQIRTALGELEERCRTILTMLYYQPEPPPYNEIAAALGIPTGSVGPTRARCLEKLKKKLEESGF